MRRIWQPMALLASLSLFQVSDAESTAQAHDHDHDVHEVRTEERDFFFAATGFGAVPGIGGGQIRIDTADVAFYDAGERAFELLFDGSDVGLKGAAIDAFAFTRFPHAFVLSFTRPLRVPGLGLVDDSDLVEFVAESPGGSDTAGAFNLLFDASDVGLTEDGEDIDAVEVVEGTLHLSTTGSFSARSGATELFGKDEDVFRCNGGRGVATDCDFNLSLNIDGSDMGMTEVGEGIDAFAGRLAGPGPDLQWVFSTTGSFTVSGASGRANDTFACRGASACGPPGSFSLLFRGSDHHTSGNITAIDFEDHH